MKNPVQSITATDFFPNKKHNADLKDKRYIFQGELLSLDHERDGILCGYLALDDRFQYDSGSHAEEGKEAEIVDLSELAAAKYFPDMGDWVSILEIEAVAGTENVFV